MITIDGIEYDVRVVYGSLSRSFEILEGSNSGTSLANSRIRDIVGTAISYALTIEPNPQNPTAYDALFEALAAPSESHAVVFPYGQETLAFDAMISGGADTYAGKFVGYNRFKTLSLTFSPIRPQK